MIMLFASLGFFVLLILLLYTVLLFVILQVFLHGLTLQFLNVRFPLLLLRLTILVLFVAGLFPKDGDAFELKYRGCEDQDQNAKEDELPAAAEGSRQPEDPGLAHVASDDLFLGHGLVVDRIGVAAGQVSAVVQDPDDAVGDHQPRDLRVGAVIADNIALAEIRRGSPVYNDVIIREDGRLHAAGEHLEHGSAENAHDVASGGRYQHVDQQGCRKDHQNRHDSVQDLAQAVLPGFFLGHFFLTQPFHPEPV